MRIHIKKENNLHYLNKE